MTVGEALRFLCWTFEPPPAYVLSYMMPERLECEGKGRMRWSGLSEMRWMGEKRWLHRLA
jgi:hypothetical protein